MKRYTVIFLEQCNTVRLCLLMNVIYIHFVDVVFSDGFSNGVHDDEDTDEWTLDEWSFEHVDEFVEDIVNKLLFETFLLESEVVNLLSGRISEELITS